MIHKCSLEFYCIKPVPYMFICTYACTVLVRKIPTFLFFLRDRWPNLFAGKRNEFRVSNLDFATKQTFCVNFLFIFKLRCLFCSETLRNFTAKTAKFIACLSFSRLFPGELESFWLAFFRRSRKIGFFDTSNVGPRAENHVLKIFK